jgi:two-component system, NtrC family, nitrogen regulation sensor histidine kinase NtrY
MTRSLATMSRPGFTRVVGWLRQPHLARILALVLTVAATLSGLATYVVLSGSLSFGGDVGLAVGLLYLDLILLLLLGVIVVRRLTQLIVARWQGLAGSRLHARMVALFSLVAVAPAIVVAVFSVMFLHYGLEAWFSKRISGALTNSLNVAQAYLEEHKEVIRADALAMANDLNRVGPSLLYDPETFEQLVNEQAAVRSLTEGVVFRGDGQVLARTWLSFSLEMERLPDWALEQAERGEVVVLTGDTEDRVRALVRLDNFVDTYLYVGRLVDPRVLEYMDQTRAVVDEYRALELRRAGIQVTFAVIFGVVALLLLLAAVWVGLTFANSLATPIAHLIRAADRVRAGDLTAHVPEIMEGSEIDRLSRGFNRMTDQLASQRSELISANSQLDQRRRFTEAVIGGVSAGVIGLDARGRITLPNRSAADFIGVEPGSLTGRPLIAVLPEVGGLLAQVSATPERPAEAQVELMRHDRTHSLLVRVAAQMDATGIIGFVVTFDDLTELLAAQRKAAWAEIARRIAHEIKNPLTPIRLSAERLKRKYLPQIVKDADSFLTSADTIVRQVDNIGRLINEFSAFARMPAPLFARESANELIRQAVHMQADARPAIAFATQLPKHDVQLYCDAGQVAQALTNLLQNAVDSIQERMESEPADRSPGRITVRLQEADQLCLIEVQDNGCGLPSELPGRLAEPYVTTRAHGTGLGLAIVKKIMEEHGGSLTLRNRPGGGASVELTFPTLQAARETAAE